MDIMTPEGIISFRGVALPPTFGLVLPILRALGVAEIVDTLCPMKAGNHIRHGTIVEFLILHYLQAAEEVPLYKMEFWAEQYNVHLLFGREACEFNDDRIRRTLEAIYPKLAEIEEAIVAAALRLYNVPTDVVDWDLTHITFAGLHEGSAYVGPGYGDGLMHHKQVHLTVHSTNRYGLPVLHRMLPGNAQQAPYAAELLDAVQERLGRKDVLILSDCAGITYDIMRQYREKGAHFLGPLAMTPAEREQLNSVPLADFRPFKYRSVKDAECVHSYYDTTLDIVRQREATPIAVRALFTHTTTRQQADSRDRRRHIKRITDRLDKISSYLNTGKYKRLAYAQEQVDKAVRDMPHIVAATLSGSDGDLQLQVTVDEDAIAREEQFDGRRILVTSKRHAEPDQLYEAYKRHTTIEAAFRIVKGEIRVNAIFLHTDERIAALLATVILALLVFALIGILAERAKLETEHYHKMTAREVIFRFQHALLQVATMNGQLRGVELQLTHEQCYIIQQLGLPKPTRHIMIPGVQLPNWHGPPPND